jgi:hypothetical protein
MIIITDAAKKNTQKSMVEVQDMQYGYQGSALQTSWTHFILFLLFAGKIMMSNGKKRYRFPVMIHRVLTGIMSGRTDTELNEASVTDARKRSHL